MIYYVIRNNVFVHMIAEHGAMLVYTVVLTQRQTEARMFLCGLFNVK